MQVVTIINYYDDWNILQTKKKAAGSLSNYYGFNSSYITDMMIAFFDC